MATNSDGQKTSIRNANFTEVTLAPIFHSQNDCELSKKVQVCLSI